MIRQSNFTLQSVAEPMLFLYTQASEVFIWDLPQIHETCIKHDMADSGILTSQPGLLKKKTK